MKISWFDRWIYTRAKTAVNDGMTHYGWYYFIPVYLADFDHEDGVLAYSRIPFLDYVMEYVLHPLEGFCNLVLKREPSFMFSVGEEIKV